MMFALNTREEKNQGKQTRLTLKGAVCHFCGTSSIKFIDFQKELFSNRFPTDMQRVKKKNIYFAKLKKAFIYSLLRKYAELYNIQFI